MELKTLFDGYGSDKGFDTHMLHHAYAHQHGQTDPSAVPQLSSCASSGHPWQLYLVRRSQGSDRVPSHCLG